MTLFNLCLFIFLVSLTQCQKIDPPAPNILPNQTWESGYIRVGQPNDKLFYILLKSSNKSISNPPLIMWFNGGPGCSSILGLFEENGPILVDKDHYFFKLNPYSWNTISDMLFVDQPLEVGFSKADSNKTLCMNETCVAVHFYTFIEKFYEMHPEYINRPVYMSGESYAGRYIPNIAAYIMRSKNLKINLKGMAIGNPSTERLIQMASLPFYLYENKIISKFTYVLLRLTALLCQVGITLTQNEANAFCALSHMGLYNLINPYDIRENKTYDDIDAALEKLLNRADVQKFIGAEKQKYESCSGLVGEWMGAEWTYSQRVDVEYILQNGMTMMLYYGDRDAQCNWRGGEWMSNSFNWEGKDKFVNQAYRQWKIEGKEWGLYRKEKNFMFLRIHDAGHMVPMDLPKIALEMIIQFIENKFE